MGGSTYSKQTGHSKKLAKSVEATALVGMELATGVDDRTPELMVTLAVERFLELILDHSPVR